MSTCASQKIDVLRSMFVPTRMTRSKPHKIRTRINTVQQPTSSNHSEMSESYNGFQSDGIAEKDEIELELERRIFGDDAGFLEGLNSYRHGEAALGSESADDGLQRAQEDLREVDDADVSLSIPIARKVLLLIKG